MGHNVADRATTGPKRFRHRGQLVQALQFDGTRAGLDRLEAFAGSRVEAAHRVGPCAAMRLQTTFGPRVVRASDWVVRTGTGGFFAMDEGLFVRQHEPVEA